MKKFWLASIVLLSIVSMSAAFAGNVPLGSSDPVGQHTDLSVSFLAQIFGSVGNVLQGTSGQMIGKLLGELNLCLLSTAGLWIVGTTIMTFIRSGTDGSFMGQNHKTPLVFLRCTLMVICLIPSPATGYSVLQDILMKIMVEGVKVADSVWKYGLDYISEGGQLWIVPTQGASDGNGNQQNPKLLTQPALDAVLGTINVAVDGNRLTNPGLGLAQRILSSEVCMVSSSIANQTAPSPNSSATQGSDITVSSTQLMPAYNWQENDYDNAIFFPGYNDSTTPSNQTILQGCGYVAWDYMSGATQYDPNNPLTCHARGAGLSNNSSGAWCQFAKTAVIGMVSDLQQAATEYACYQAGNPIVGACGGANVGNPSQVNKDVANALFNATINYANTITPLVNGKTQDTTSGAYDFIQTAENQGWFSAGRFYWDLSHVESAMQQAKNMENYTPRNPTNTSFQQPNGGNYDATADIMSPLESGDGNHTTAYDPVTKDNSMVSKGVNNLLNGLGGNSGITSNVLNQINAYAGASATGNSTTSNDNAGISFGNKVLNVLLPVVGDLSKLTSSFDHNHVGTDPIVWLHNVGTICIDIAGDVWFAPIGSLLGLLAVFSVCRSELDPFGVITTALSWLKPFFMALAAGFFGCGAMLAIYIPLYPFEVFTLSSLSWMALVLEIMIAAPVMALGIGNSQGHDVLGKAEHAVWMVFSGFIGPSTRVIGLCAGMILSYVGLKALIWGFSGISHDLFKNHYSGAAPNDILQASKDAMHTMQMSPGQVAQDVGAGAAAGGAMFGPVGAVGGALSGLLPAFSHMLDRLLVLPLFLMVFTYMVYAVTTQCFNVIYLMANVVKYVGGHAEHGPMEQMLGQIKDGLSSGAGQIGQAGSKGGKGLAKHMDGVGKQSGEDESFGGDEGGGGEGGGGAEGAAEEAALVA